MAGKPNIVIGITAQSSGLNRGLKNARGQLTGFQKSTQGASLGLSTLVKGFALVGGAHAVNNFLSGAIAEAREAQKVTALTNNVIKTTGGVANVTAKQVGNLANSISRKTGIDDEAIQTGANLLLTFKNVRNEVGKGNDVFNQATAAAVDLSAAGFGSVDSASKMLGKALNDPLKGITALSRAGVTFTAGQKEQIKTMVESGNVLGAQKIIMGEVQSQVGGAAAAQATAGEKLRVTIDNIKESIGSKMLPILDRLQGYLAKKLPQWMAAAGKAFDRVKQAAEKFSGPLDKVIGFFKKNPAVVKTFAVVLGVLAVALGVVTGAVAILSAVMAINPAVLIIVGIAALAAALVYAYKKSESFRNIVQGAMAGVRAAITFLMPVFQSLWSTVQTVFSAIMQIVSGAFAIIRGIFQVVGGLLKGDWGMVWTGIKSIVSGVISVITGIIRGLWAIIKGIFSAGGAAIKAVFSAAWSAIKSAASAGISGVVSLVKALPGKMKSAIGNLGGLLKGAGKAVIQGLLDGIGEMVGKLKSKLSSVTKLIPSWKGPYAKDKKLLTPAGKAIMGGLISGIESQETSLRSTLRGVTGIISDTSFTLGGVGTGNLSRAAILSGNGAGNTTVVNVTLNVPPTADPVATGKEVAKVLKAYQTAGGRI